jgi:hypothetical protein
MRGRVCHLQLLLTLVSAVILGSQSLGIRDHILLSQIRDFPFRQSQVRLNHLTLLRMNYSRRTGYTSPCLTVPLLFCLYPLPRERACRTVAQQLIIPRLLVAAGRCSPNRCLAMVTFVTVYTKDDSSVKLPKKKYNVRRFVQMMNFISLSLLRSSSLKFIHILLQI